eukprot:GHVU01101256.1.p1 GENE.GHVU01101256.1~~GHVU01101256.1.p1  ORF type:complete len:209 (-),score=71.22 GHVU01101256.1:414-1040(-)
MAGDQEVPTTSTGQEGQEGTTQDEAKQKEEELRAAKAAEAERIANEAAAAKAAERAAEAKAREEEMKALKAEGDELSAFPPETIKTLASGLQGLNAEALEHMAQVLSSLQAKQVALIEQLAQEDRKVMTLPHMADVAQALAHVPTYTKKLQDIRKDMDAVSNRVKTMRKRAAKLYTKKQQEDNSAAQQRQLALQAERSALSSDAPAAE